MSDETKAEIDKIISPYNERLSATTDAEKKQADLKKAADEEFVALFAQVRKDVIIPVMEEIGELIKQKGHDYDANNLVQKPMAISLDSCFSFEIRKVALV